MTNRIFGMDATRRAPSVLSGPPARDTPSATTLAAALFLALPLSLVLGACGQKGPLRLPEATTPAATAPSRSPEAASQQNSAPRRDPAPGAPTPESRP